MNTGAAPHSHMSSLGTYETSPLQAKFRFSEIRDNMQLLCYSVTALILHAWKEIDLCGLQFDSPYSKLNEVGVRKDNQRTSWNFIFAHVS